MTEQNKQPPELYFVDTTEDEPETTLGDMVINALAVLILLMTGGMLLHTWLTI